MNANSQRRRAHAPPQRRLPPAKIRPRERSPMPAVDRADTVVYARVLQRLQTLALGADAVVAKQISRERALIVRLMVHPVRCPTSAHRWAWRLV